MSQQFSQHLITVTDVVIKLQSWMLMKIYVKIIYNMIQHPVKVIKSKRKEYQIIFYDLFIGLNIKLF